MINYGSFDYVKIVGVKKDISDKTLTIPTHIIVPMNADLTTVEVGCNSNITLVSR